MTELTNLEICKKIAEIEGFTIPECGHTNDGVWCSFMPNNCYGHYNPLTDDALCFQLMVKHKMQLTTLICGDYICVKQNVFVNINNLTKGLSSPNKAICLAIIEAHNE